MIKKSKRIKPVVDLAHNDEREAAKVLGQALANVNEHVKQLEQLRQYQKEYAERFNQAVQSGQTTNKVNDFRLFLDKVKSAVKAQEGVVEGAKRALEEKKRFWFSKRGRSKALDVVLERYLKEEQAQDGKREQKEQDEHSQNVRSRR